MAEHFPDRSQQENARSDAARVVKDVQVGGSTAETGVDKKVLCVYDTSYYDIEMLSLNVRKRMK